MSITPQKKLPGIFITEQFPEVTAVSNPPALTEILVGSQRTVIHGEVGILGGPALSTAVPLMSSNVTEWTFLAAVDTAATADLTINFAGLSIAYTGSAAATVEAIIDNIRTNIFASGFTASLVKDIYASTTSVSGELKVRIIASDAAVDSGFLPSIVFTTIGAGMDIDTIAGGSLASGAKLAVTMGSQTTHAFPILNSNWNSIFTRRAIEEVLYGLDASQQNGSKPYTEPERFYFDTTTRMQAALSKYLQLSSHQKAYFGDFVYVANASTIASAPPSPLTVSKVPLNGSQRVTVISVRTGIEYELRLGYDYTCSIGVTAGAYQQGNTVSFLGAGPTWATLGTDPVLIRLVYVPDRYVMPLPVLYYAPVFTSGQGIYEAVPLTSFTIDPIAGQVSVSNVSSPVAARVNYSGVYNVSKTAGALSSLVNMAPRIQKSISASVIGNTNQSLDMGTYGTKNIVTTSIVIKRADGTILTQGTDWTFTASTNTFLFLAAGPHTPCAPASNPLRINFIDMPQVSYVGSPTVTLSSALSNVTYDPTITHLGGGLFNVSAPESGYIDDIIMATAGSVYSTAPTVIISGAGSLATIAISVAGTLHAAGAVTITGGTGVNATAICTVDGGGAITAVYFTNFGTGYTVGDTVTWTKTDGGGVAASGTCTLDTSKGSGATATCAIDNAKVFSFNVTSRGTGYVSAPKVALVGGGYTTIGTATALVGPAAAGTLQSIAVTNAGAASHTGASASLTIAAALMVSRLEITNGGTGYTTATITFASGAAAATAIISGGSVVGAYMTNFGAAYDPLAPPLVTITGDGINAAAKAVVLATGSGAAATVLFSGADPFRVASSVHITNRGTGYTEQPGILRTDENAVFSASVGSGSMASIVLSATIEYPYQPELRLEFMADRTDLDGTLYYFGNASEISSTPQMADTYAGSAVAPDLTVANPTLHAAAIALSVSGVPVGVGFGAFTSQRISGILNVLQRQPNAYWLVGVTQDSSAAFQYLGAHIDKMVATIAGTQIHYAPGGFRVMLNTLDQRNEVQLMPLQVDTTGGIGYLVNGTGGGIAVRADLVGMTGDPSQIAAGQFVEFYQIDATGDAIAGSSDFPKAAPKRLLITDVDISNLAAAEFTVSDDSLPPTLDAAGSGDTTFHIKMGSPFRIIKVRQDLRTGEEIGQIAAAIGAAANGRRRWIMQPDIVTISDAGTTRAVPGYYRSVVASAVRANNPPHQGLTNFALPVLNGVHRNSGFYTNDDTLNLFTDGGIDYAVQKSSNGPVTTLQQMTADRLNQYTQEPTVTQIIDYASAAFKTNLGGYIGLANITPSVVAAIDFIIEGTIEQLKLIKGPLLGSMILRGRRIDIAQLPITATNSGISIEIGITVAQVINEIRLNIAIDTPVSTATA